MREQADFDLVNKLIVFDPETGLLRARRSGLLYTCYNPAGYLRIQINGRFYQGHRVAWLLAYGNWPEIYVDHVNGIRHDNRVSNLRLATKSENNRNRCVQKNNRIGIKGVHFCRKTQRWRVMISMDKLRISVGRFDTVAEAVNAYEKAAGRLHGEFARLSSCGVNSSPSSLHTAQSAKLV